VSIASEQAREILARVDSLAGAPPAGLEAALEAALDILAPLQAVHGTIPGKSGRAIHVMSYVPRGGL
jgi:hypothetical protein